MKKVLIAGVLGIAAAVLAHLHVVSQRYYPLVKVAGPEGITFIAVQDERQERQACGRANERFLGPLTAGCKECKVLAARCERVITGEEEKALLERRPNASYLVVAPGLRMSITGPEARAKANCTFIAKDMVSRGMRTAACIPPQPAS